MWLRIFRLNKMLFLLTLAHSGYRYACEVLT